VAGGFLAGVAAGARMLAGVGLPLWLQITFLVAIGGVGALAAERTGLGRLAFKKNL
jgi:hypothetical protein